MKALLWSSVSCNYPFLRLIVSIPLISIPVLNWISYGEGLSNGAVAVLCILLFLGFGSVLLPEELARRRSKALRVLPLSERDEARSLWILCVALYPTIFLSVSMTLQFMYWIAGKSDSVDFLAWLLWTSMFIFLTVLMFCTARFFPIASITRIPSFRESIPYICSPLGGAIALLVLAIRFPDTSETLWLVAWNHWSLVMLLTFFVLWISYLSAVGVVRTQRKLELGANASTRPANVDVLPTRLIVPGVTEKGLLFLGTLTVSTLFYWLMYRLIEYPSDGTFGDLITLWILGQLVIQSIEPMSLRACRTLRPLPFSRNQLTRHLISLPLITMLGLASGYAIATVSVGSPFPPSAIVWICLFSLLSILLTLPVLITLKSPNWAVTFYILLFISALIFLIDTPLNATLSPVSLLLIFAVCGIAYRLIYRLVLTSSALYRPENWVLHKGVR